MTCHARKERTCLFDIVSEPTCFGDCGAGSSVESYNYKSVTMDTTYHSTKYNIYKMGSKSKSCSTKVLQFVLKIFCFPPNFTIFYIVIQEHLCTNPNSI